MLSIFDKDLLTLTRLPCLAWLLPVADEHVEMVDIHHAPHNAYLPVDIINKIERRKHYYPVIIKSVINKNCSIEVDIPEQSPTHSNAHLEYQQ